MFTVYFRNSTTTPSQPGLRTLVDAALDDCAASWTGQEAELALPDGSFVYLFGENADDGMLLEYPILTQAVAHAVFSIADRTTSFVLDDPFDPSAIKSANSVGEPRAPDTSIGRYTSLIDAAAVHGWLSDLVEYKGEAYGVRSMVRASTMKKSSFEDQTFLSKLADVLFGKKI